MSAVGYNIYYTPPNGGTQYKIDMSQLDAMERDCVNRVIENPDNLVYQFSMKQVLANNPAAVQEVVDGSGPLRAPSLSTEWYFNPANVDINFLIGFVVELLIDIGQSMSKQSMADAYGDIAEYRALADKRLNEELNAAKMEFAAAITSAVFSMVTAGVGMIGGGVSMKHAKADFDKMDDLGNTKMKLTDRKQECNEVAEDFELRASKFSAKAQTHEFNAATAKQKARQADDAADARKKEVADLEDMLHNPERKADLDKAGGVAQVEIDIKKKTEESVRLGKDAESFRKTASDEKLLAAENTKYANQMNNVAKGIRLEATKEELDVGLTKVGIDERRLDVKTQQHGNLTRLISVIAPLFTSIGQFAAAFVQQDSKAATAYANFLTSEMEITQMLKGIEDEIVKNFRELINEAIQFRKSIEEGQNQQMANTAQHI